MSRKRVAIYVRVSTLDQSCELQEREARQFAEARGWTIYRIYEDKATGTNGNRPMLKAMLKDVHERKVDALIVWKLDRLFRSLKDLVVTLQTLGELGVDFVSLKDNIDLSTSAGRLMLHMLGAFAEFEASLIRERVRAGIRNARAKGKRLGRPCRIDRRSVLEMRAQGKSLSQIASALGTTKSGVSKILKKQGAKAA